MSYVPNYAYDIFISYATGDNLPLDKDEPGWVDFFEEALQKELNDRLGPKVSLFRDAKLQRSSEISEHVAEALVKSAIFICVLSPRYLQSSWCVQELRHFLKHSGAESIVKVVKTPFDAPNVPFYDQELLGPIKNLVEHRFYSKEEQANRLIELTPDLRHGDYAPFLEKIDEVCADLIRLFHQLHHPEDQLPPIELSLTPEFTPLADAYDRLVQFARRFGEPHVTLAMHAAVPLGLTPELVHFLRIYFAKAAPQIAEADLLLSPLCREVGGGAYEMYPEVRDLLLAELQEDEAFGAARINQVAEFLMVFATRQLRVERHAESRNFLVAQQWAAFAQREPGEAARELAAALRTRLSAQNPAGSLRLAQLVRTLNAPLMGQDNVLLYAAGVESLALGDAARAQEVFAAFGPAQQAPRVQSIPMPALPELAGLWPAANANATPTTNQQSLNLPSHITALNRIPVANYSITQAEWSPDGKWLAFTLGTAAIHFWAAEKKNVKDSLQIGQPVQCFAWSPDSLYIAAGLSNGNVWMGDIDKSLRPHIARFQSDSNDVKWSPNQRWQAWAFADGSIGIFESRDLQQREGLQIHEHAATCLDWSPSGANYLAAGYANNEVIIWDTNDWKMRRICHGHRAPVTSIVVAPNRVFIAAGAADGAIHIWRVDETEEDFQMVRHEHSAAVTNLCFSPNGWLLASKSVDGTVRIWRVQDWQCVAVIDVHGTYSVQTSSYPTVLAFHPTEPWLATCVENNQTISILEIDQTALVYPDLQQQQRREQRLQ